MTSTLMHALQRGVRGRVSDDVADLVAVRSDFGAILRRLPLLTVRPTCTADVVHTMKTASAARMPVTVRSRGNSISGQTLSDGAISLDMRDFARVGAVSADRTHIVTEPGAVWHAVIARTLVHHRIPPVRPSNLFTTVGGTHAVGGLSPESHRYGCVADHCRSIEIVLADGSVVRASDTVERELFAHTLCGLGQIAVMTEIAVGVEAFLRYRHAWRLVYGSLSLLLADMERLAMQRIDGALSAEVVPLRGLGRFAYVLDVVLTSGSAPVTFETTPLADCAPLRVVDRGRAEMRYRALDTVTPRVGPVGDRPAWGHPWIDLLLPPQRVATFFARARHALPASLLASAHVIFWPLRADVIRCPLFVLPCAPYAVLNSIMPSVAPEETAVAARRMQDLARWGELLGGKRYLYGLLDAMETHWPRHFGASWSAFNAAKSRYDANTLLNPGFIQFHEPDAAPPRWTVTQ